MPEPVARAEVGRYCWWPTQASSYLTGLPRDPRHPDECLARARPRGRGRRPTRRGRAARVPRRHRLVGLAAAGPRATRRAGVRDRRVTAARGRSRSVTGRPYRDVVTDGILRPLAMDASTASINAGHPRPARDRAHPRGRRSPVARGQPAPRPPRGSRRIRPTGASARRTGRRRGLPADAAPARRGTVGADRLGGGVSTGS